MRYSDDFSPMARAHFKLDLNYGIDSLFTKCYLAHSHLVCCQLIKKIENIIIVYDTL